MNIEDKIQDVLKELTDRVNELTDRVNAEIPTQEEITEYTNKMIKAGIEVGYKYANEKIEPTIREIHDGVFAQGKQMGKEEALKDLLEIVYAEQEKQLVEPIDCEECAFNSGLSTMADVIINVIKERINEV